jgi:hypothetical protein
MSKDEIIAQKRIEIIIDRGREVRTGWTSLPLSNPGF